MRSTERPADDLTTRARIREAAIARFPVEGYAKTTIRAIAADAGVSPGLVVHHFESKEGLRRECDRYVIDTMHEAKTESLRQGTYRQAGAVAAAYHLMEPLLRYLAWTLRSGGEAACRIFDDLLDEVTVQLEEGLWGKVAPGDDPRKQAAVVVTMQLGGLVLHDHYSRAMGVDMLTGNGLIEVAPYVLRVYSGELFDPEVMTDVTRTMQELNDQTTDETEAT